jgi:hypothetical protein
MEGCKEDSPARGMTQKEMDAYCGCVLAKTIQRYSNSEAVEGDLPQEFVARAGIECLREARELK